MSSNRHSRRTQAQPTYYAAVPTSPTRSGMYQPGYTPSSRNPPHRRSNSASHIHNSRGALAQGVATGAVGGMYGPYSYNPNYQDAPNQSQFSNVASDMSSSEKTGHPPPATTATVTAAGPQYLWDRDPEADDALHNPDPIRDAKLEHDWTLFSSRGWMNVIALLVLLAGLLMLFAGYPILIWWRKPQAARNGFNLGGINASGQIPDLQGVPSLIDGDTPQSVYTRTGTDGKKYNLVFSDEFNKPGRSFYPGDDPYWEAADLHYWPTGDFEWYDPSAVTTANGHLVLTMTQEPIHNLNFKSGMITSWNKLCFTTGYIEVSISMPGSPKAPGFWPGAWTMGNLGRAGYGATTEGMWPYSYDTCDIGTFPNQTDPNGNPTSSATGGNEDGPLSFLPGQRLSACTCSGSDHPGPSSSTGRGAPEIDIIEAQVDVDIFRGEVSQSFQIAPYNYKYNFDDTKTTIYDTSLTKYNSYKGGPYQQAVSAVTYIDDINYDGQGFAPYAFEWWSDPKHRDQGYITWFSQGQRSWTMTAGAVGPDSTSLVGQRLVPEEPMYVILNFGMAASFQAQDYKHMQFPAHMYIDYVRIYQREGTRSSDGLTCDPPSHPTKNYIDKHIQAYTNPNLTTWAQAGNTFPRNSKFDGC
ncbi:glycoside hydrolase family 16 protein [Moniliophthora roreri MCA 2997]|uniref:Glycoside hydrolase family 16 protein n=1 Tax=Moniliophthora roreri (strain MCA 2997) TaxID=1381753 RepID=V2XSG3_MONRO|nr:glycoside hydrolase family 16 protein [Moniliophthora roreri MCA 2997]KAI3616353.1 glycoside hydrolase family 16 protein [Moniliophthora roreri]